jgi:hypothetical protein
MRDTWRELVPCRDGAGRKKYFQVLVTDEFNVAVITPPGDSAVWNPAEVNQLVEAFRSAQFEALQRRGLNP